MKNRYLPSKQFIARIAVALLLAIIIFSIYKISAFIKNRSSQNNKEKPLIVKDVVQKDSNNNGIADWEETLWGLDPTKNGSTNKEFIAAKRQALAVNTPEDTIQSSNDKTISENENLSREFFAVITSLQQSGNLDSQSIAAISELMGDKITATPLTDTYTREQLKIKADTKNTITEYYTALRELILAYEDKDIGNELTFISVGLQNNDPGALATTKSIVSAYKSFGKDLLKIPVPNSLLSIHLSLANNYEKTGQTIDSMTQMLADPITGMKALINYKKYSDALADNLQKLSDIFTQKWYTESN